MWFFSNWGPPRSHLSSFIRFQLGIVEEGRSQSRRPQDIRDEIIKMTRRTNFGIIPPPPTDYSARVELFSRAIPNIPRVPYYRALDKAAIKFVDRGSHLWEILKNPEWNSSVIFAVDFEYVQAHSYDGKQFTLYNVLYYFIIEQQYILIVYCFFHII